MNPMNVVKNFIGNGGNPKQLLANFMQQNNQNPMINNLIKSAQQGNYKEVEKFARNMFNEQRKKFR